MLVKVIVYLLRISILELSLWARKDAKISIYPQARLFLSTASRSRVLFQLFDRGGQYDIIYHEIT